MSHPKDPPNDAQLNRLLSGRSRMTRADKEAVLDAVLERQEQSAPARSRLRGLLSWGIAAVAVAGGIVLLARPHPDPFTARGGATAPSFSVHCAKDMASGRCPQGSKLLFRVEPLRSRRLALAARSSTGVIWYVTDQDLTKLGRDGLLDLGIPLRPDHAPGRYQIVGVFSDRPLSKDELRPLLAGESAAGVSVVTRELEVEP